MTSTSLDEIMDSAIDLMRIIRHKMACDARGSSLNFLQIHALALINDKEGITMKELADILHISSPSATAFVNRLVKMGWLTRLHDRKNRKFVRLRMTPRGRLVLRRHKLKRITSIRSALSILTSSELAVFARILKKLHASHVTPKS